MCGIVGYVGARQAQDVVIDGLRRLEYRGYDSAGIALVVRRTRIAVAKKAGKLANLEKAIADDPLPASTTGIGHTRWATHGAPNDVNAHPHLGFGRRVALVHNGIIENFAELRARIEADSDELGLVSETDTEVAAQLLELQLASGRRPDRGDAAGLRPAGRRVHAGGGRRARPDPGRGRPAELAAGRRPGRRRELPRLRRGGVHRAHPRGARARPGPGRHDHPRLGRGHRLRRAPAGGPAATTSTGTCRPPRRRATTGSCARRSTSSRAPWRTRCSGGVRPPDSCTSTRCGSRTRSSATSTRSSSSPAGPRSTPAWWRSTRSSTGAGSRSRSSWPRSSATATRSSTTRRSSWRSGSRARPPTPCRRSGTRGPSGPRCWRSATPTARRSRASPTRSSTPTPGPRSGSRRPRAS